MSKINDKKHKIKFFICINAQTIQNIFLAFRLI
jgi:hypothetical protein